MSRDKFRGKLAFFGGIKNAKFRSQVTPGDTLRLCVELEKLDREALTALLDGTAAALTQRAEQNPAQAPRALEAVDLVKKLRAATAFYVGGGHFCGWLCAARFAGNPG